MQKNHIVWYLLTIGVLGVLFVWHAWLRAVVHLSLDLLQLSYAVGFGLFALFLSGAIARLWPSGQPALWRMLTVLMGAVVIAGEMNLHAYPHALFLPLGGAALIGVSLISVMAKILPDSVLKIWFDLENKK